MRKHEIVSTGSIKCPSVESVLTKPVYFKDTSERLAVDGHARLFVRPTGEVIVQLLLEQYGWVPKYHFKNREEVLDQFKKYTGTGKE